MPLKQLNSAKSIDLNGVDLEETNNCFFPLQRTSIAIKKKKEKVKKKNRIKSKNHCITGSK